MSWLSGLAAPVRAVYEAGPTGLGLAHYARTPRIGAAVQHRQAGQPDHITRTAWKAQHRLYRVHKRFKARGKPPNVATIAVARELAAFLCAAATGP